jgi:glyoxylase-like metal-dependent hydrolase (beta-lactamase superfamily II)
MAQQLAEDVWWLDLGHVNAYLVADEVLTLVDAGMPWHIDRLREHVADAGFALADVERVLVTHHDLDHVGGLAAVAEPTEVFVGERDADFVAMRRSPPLTNRKTAFQRVADLLRSAPSVPIQPVADGDEIGTFTAVHTPGHTAGHVAYVSSERDVAFVGDLVMSDGAGLSPSPWYLSQDTEAIPESIRRLEDRMPVVDVVAPGHGDPLVDGGYGAIAELAENVGHGSQ